MLGVNDVPSMGQDREKVRTAVVEFEEWKTRVYYRIFFFIP